jgi:tripartite-type tricarboxylate transporter receptor subunit TctC
MTKFSILAARTVAIGLLAAHAGLTAAQQTYPTKLIRMVIPYPAGGGIGLAGHLLSEKMSKSMGQPVIVDNIGGGNTIVGASTVARAAPDGYTIMLMAMPHVIVPLLFPTPYDAIKDFAPVATVTSSEQVLVINPSLPANNLQELLALAKSKPGQMYYATVGTGGPGHLATESINIMTGAKMTQVPYKIPGPALTDLISGQVQVYLSVPNVTLPHIKTGRIKAIAVSGDTRMTALPEVPTFAEAGLPGFEARTWYGVLAPRDTPKPIIDKLSAEIAKALSQPDVQEKLIAGGQLPFISSPEKFGALMKADMARYEKIIKTANVKGEQ